MASSRIEVLNQGGYRSDGRKQRELRTIAVDLAPQGVADGAATISHGLTTVLVSVFGPREAKLRSQTLHDRATISVEVGVAAFSTGERRKRSKGDKRLLELASTIKATFEPVIQTALYPRSQIDIYLHVLEQDGSLLQTCINGTTLALINAGIPLLDFVCAVSGGVHVASPLLDLNQLEENDVPHLTLALMPKTKKITLVTMETRLHVERFEEIFRLAAKAAEVIHQEMRGAIRTKANTLVASMGPSTRAPVDGADRDGNQMDED